MVRALIPARNRQHGGLGDFAGLTDEDRREARGIAGVADVDADAVEARGVGLYLLLAEVELLAVHPLNRIHGGGVRCTGGVYDLLSQELFGYGNDVHCGHLQSLVNSQKLVVEFGKTPFVKQAPIGQAFTLQKFVLKLLLHPHNAMKGAVVADALHIQELGGFIAVEALDLREQVLVQLESLVIGLAVLEAPAFAIALRGPRNRTAVGIIAASGEIEAELR